MPPTIKFPTLINQPFIDEKGHLSPSLVGEDWNVCWPPAASLLASQPVLAEPILAGKMCSADEYITANDFPDLSSNPLYRRLERDHLTT